jgi:hypothetical protein
MKAMSSTVTVALWIAASCVPCTGEAALFKCVGKDGAVSYQAEPCPVADGEKQLKAPAAGPVQPPARGSRWQEGWNDGDITAMEDSCVAGVIGPARRDFAAAAAKAQDSSAQFPEAELTPSVKAMCLCFARRVGSTVARADFQRDRQAILRRMNDEAMNGGACKPEGMLGEVMGRSRQQ